MGRGFKKPEKLTTSFITEWLLFLRSLRYCAIRLIMCWKLIFTNHFVRITTSYIWYSKCWMMIWLGTNWSSYFLSGNWWTNSFWLALEIHHGTVLQDGQFAALRNKYWSLDFIQILMIFFNQNHQFCKFLTIFLLKLSKIRIF